MKIAGNTLVATAAMALLASGMPQNAHAQGVLKKHPVASGIVAGVAAHHYAKKGAAKRAAVGKKPNFAERHPVLSGVAAGAATHHILKKK